MAVRCGCDVVHTVIIMILIYLDFCYHSLANEIVHVYSAHAQAHVQ